jgi:hypothetical protein
MEGKTSCVTKDFTQQVLFSGNDRLVVHWKSTDVSEEYRVHLQGWKTSQARTTTRCILQNRNLHNRHCGKLKSYKLKRSFTKTNGRSTDEEFTLLPWNTETRDCILSWGRWIQSTWTHTAFLSHILMLLSHLHPVLLSWFWHSGFPQICAFYPFVFPSAV